MSAICYVAVSCAKAITKFLLDMSVPMTAVAVMGIFYAYG